MLASRIISYAVTHGVPQHVRGVLLRFWLFRSRWVSVQVQCLKNTKPVGNETGNRCHAFGYVLKGECLEQRETGRWWFRLREAGDFAYLPPGTPFTVDQVSPLGCWSIVLFLGRM